MYDKGVFIDGDLWEDFWKVCRARKIPIRGFLTECVRQANTDPEFADIVSNAYHERKQRDMKELVARVNAAPTATSPGKV